MSEDDQQAKSGKVDALGRAALEAPKAKKRPAVAPLGGIGLVARVRARYASLSPSARAVADLMVGFPGRLATDSATELAQRAGASKASVTRCVQRLGYANYAEVRNEVRRAQHWGSPVYLDTGANPRTSPRSALESHAAADMELLGATARSLAGVDLAGATQALVTARRVVFLGYRNSHLLAGYARSQLALLREGVELLPRVAETLAGGLAGLGPGDVVVAVGFRRRVRAFQSALEAVHRAGARLLYVTDPTGAAGASRAEWTLVCHCNGISMLDSYVAAMSVLNFLVTQVAHELGDAGRARMARIEQLHGELGDLV